MYPSLHEIKGKRRAGRSVRRRKEGLKSGRIDEPSRETQGLGITYRRLLRVAPFLPTSYTMSAFHGCETGDEGIQRGGIYLRRIKISTTTRGTRQRDHENGRAEQRRPRKQTSRGCTITGDNEGQGWGVGMGCGITIQGKATATTHH